MFYDRDTKRIIKRKEKRVKTGDMPSKMIMDMAIMLETDQDPRFTLRARTALIHASEDNMDKVITDLE